jgi:hypothetical protein
MNKRTYFSQQGLGKTNPNQPVKSKDLHWDLFEAICKLLPDSDPVRTPLLSAIRLRDIKGTFEQTEVVDARVNRYTRTTPPDQVRLERQVATFLKKFPFSKEESPWDPELAALISMQQAEDQCRLTNTRLRSMSKTEHPPWVHRAQVIVQQVLGYMTPAVMREILEGGSHGPGTSATNKSGRVTEYYKYADLPYSVSRSAMPYAIAAISANPHWMRYIESKTVLPDTQCVQPQSSRAFRERQLVEHNVVYIDHDTITTVPKSAKTHRPIAISTNLDMFLQLGVKTVMERRLKKVGVDLTDQSRNQKYAFLGSKHAYIDGVSNETQFSTIDLAAASDTISFEIVKLLLPRQWFAVLCDLRFTRGLAPDGTSVEYEKFSAMGNGFTFPLESLIFYAIARAVAEDFGHYSTPNDISVYGDDVIVRLPIASAVRDAYHWAGFTLNDEKSFFEGPFKESCGADFFNGASVRPFYLKKRIVSYEDLYFIANSCTCMSLNGHCHEGHSALFAKVMSYIPRQHRRYLPLALLRRDKYGGAYLVNGKQYAQPVDNGLCVPYSFVNVASLRPWLSKGEMFDITESKRLAHQLLDYQSPVYIYSSYEPIKYRGRSDLRYLMSLNKEERGHSHMRDDEHLLVQSSAAGAVTRRSSLKPVVTVATIPNWDGNVTVYEQSLLFLML